MTAVAFHPSPTGRRQGGVVRYPTAPLPGRAPQMIVGPDRVARPLLDRQVHAQFCGFRTVTANPTDRRLLQCNGCRCWVLRPSTAVTR